MTNRLTPIAASIHTITGYPKKLIVYKTAASRFYWVRVYFNGRYFIKTTKSESLKDAKKFAIQFYQSVLISAATHKTSDTSRSFAVVGRKFLDTQSKNSIKVTHRNDEARFRSDLLPVFGEQDIATITNAQISQLLDRLRERNLSPATQKHFLVVLSKIMKFAVENDLMMRLPTFPKVTGRLKTAQKRDYFTLEEYDTLCAETERCAAEELIVRGVPITMELFYLFQFMVNSFIRPSDLRVLKFKHLQLRKDGRESWFALNHPATKTNANEVQAMPATVGIINKLIEEKKRLKQPRSKDDYIFLPSYANRDTAMAIIARQFRKVLKRTGLEGATGKNLTLYSLRHTSIMLRLIKGNVDTLVLARNARTSQQMIDQFYAQHLTTDQVRRQLHAFITKDKVRPATKKKQPVSNDSGRKSIPRSVPSKNPKTPSDTKKSSRKPVRKRVE
jgi:integrase